jgi:dTDP-glucose 4,6-dehydratase
VSSDQHAWGRLPAGTHSGARRDHFLRRIVDRREPGGRGTVKVPIAKLPSQDLDHVVERLPGLWDRLRGQSIFITGGTGFVGAWLVESLLHAHERFDLNVRLVLLTRDAEAFRARSPHIAGHRAVQVLQANVAVFSFPQGEFPYVIHAATERQAAPTTANPQGSFDTDIAATRRVLQFAAEHGTQRLLFTSSGAVYGKQPSDVSHVPEEHAGAPITTAQNSAYGEAKRVSEFLCAAYARQHGFVAVIARLFAFVGPRLPLDENYAVGNFIGDVISGGPVRIAGDGTPYRSYLYAADLAIWLWKLLLCGQSARPYNVGSGKAVNIADLARIVVAATRPGTPIDIAQKPVPGAIPARYVPSVERAKSELQLVPTVPLAEGIRRTYQWSAAQS